MKSDPRPISDIASDQASDARLRQWDRHLHAFVAFSKPADTAMTSDTAAGAACPAPLRGITIGVKDNMDVAGLPTRNGSDACRDAAPAVHDAPVVAALRRAGARIVGKTTSTEFAFTDPTDCRNPHDLSRSPGGSSSGSGAAVGAGIVDVALGTQTAGSLCRPAAYCGAVGFKPTFGTFSTVGVTPLAPSFDTVGIIARSVALATDCFFAICPAAQTAATSEASDLAVLTGLLDGGGGPSSDMQAALDHASAAARDLGCRSLHMDLAVDVPAIVNSHRIVMNYEAAQAHRALLAEGKAALLKPKFRAGLEAGAGTTAEQAAQAAQMLAAASTAFWRSLDGVDLVLSLPVPDAAPLIGGTTGFQDWLTPWTVFAGPLLCLPWGTDGQGRPLSVLLATAPGRDADLLAFGAMLERGAPVVPRPRLPG